MLRPRERVDLVTTSMYRVHDNGNPLYGPMSDTQTNDPLVGQIVDGKFEITRLLGQGAIGVVYEANQIALGRKVAIKFLKTVQCGDHKQIERFRQEAETLTRLSHDNIVQIYAFGFFHTQPYMALEHITGQTLAEYLIQKNTLSLSQSATLFVPILEAIGHAHQKGFIHRDLKPGNVMLMHTEAGMMPKILDLGLAKLADAAQQLTRTGAILGTPQYMSPEQYLSQPVTPQSDIYSLGCMLHECLTGRLPFDGDSFISLAHAHCNQAPPPLVSPDGITFPDSVQALVGKALNKQPDHRYASCQEFIEALEAVRADPTKMPVALQSEQGKTKGADPGNKAHQSALTRKLIPLMLTLAAALVFVLIMLQPVLQERQIDDLCQDVRMSLADSNYDQADKIFARAITCAQTTTQQADLANQAKEILSEKQLEAIAPHDSASWAKLTTKAVGPRLRLLQQAINVLAREHTFSPELYQGLCKAANLAEMAPAEIDVLEQGLIALELYQTHRIRHRELCLNIVYQFAAAEQVHGMRAGPTDPGLAKQNNDSAKRLCETSITALEKENLPTSYQSAGKLRLILCAVFNQQSRYQEEIECARQAQRDFDRDASTAEEKALAQLCEARSYFVMNERACSSGHPPNEAWLRRVDTILNGIMLEDQAGKFKPGVVPMPEVFYERGAANAVLGNLHQNNADFEAATRCLTEHMKAIDKDCPLNERFLAHYIVASCSQQLGDHVQARQQADVALQLLDSAIPAQQRENVRHELQRLSATR